MMKNWRGKGKAMKENREGKRRKREDSQREAKDREREELIIVDSLQPHTLVLYRQVIDNATAMTVSPWVTVLVHCSDVFVFVK